MTTTRANEIADRIVREYGHDPDFLRGAIRAALIGTIDDAAKLATELKWIAGVRFGLEQDVAGVEASWPASKRGSRADKAFQSLLSRVHTIFDVADKALADYSGEK